jgi:hypothetical protein
VEDGKELPTKQEFSEKRGMNQEAAPSKSEPKSEEFKET